MEGLGEKFQKAREARNLTLEEAARMTKIRPGRLAEIEAEDFSNFASLAYAKGFVLIYGKFLAVDVSPYLEAFETSEHVTVDGYSYLQDNPAPKPRRQIVERRVPSDRPSLIPFIVIGALIFLGFWFLKTILNLQRIGPKKETTALATSESAPSPFQSANLTPSKALTPQSSPPPVAAATPVPVPASTQATPAGPAGGEPEVRRAEQVKAGDVAASGADVAGPGADGTNSVEIRPLKKTYLKVMVDNEEQPAFEKFVNPTDGLLQLRGRRLMVRVLDRAAVEIKKNGKPIARNDPDVIVE